MLEENRMDLGILHECFEFIKHAVLPFVHEVSLMAKSRNIRTIEVAGSMVSDSVLADIHNINILVPGGNLFVI